MKIIAKVDQNNYIVQANTEELAVLTGSRPMFSEFYVNDSIPVRETWRKLEGLLELQKEFDRVSKTLDAMRNLLDHTGKDLVRRIEEAGNETRP